MKASETQWPDDADGDVLRRMAARGFDFGQPCLIDFNVDFDSWPPPEVALTRLEQRFPSTRTCPSSDGGGYVQFQVYGKLSYELVVNTQRVVSNEMATFGGVCDSWGVLH
jgi:Regulator of ribonuclease activity B